MLCETCHSKEATVHIASVIYPAANVDARHFCEPCAQVAQTANPVLSAARTLAPVHVKPVMGIATPARVKIGSIENKLAELDPMWEAFCAQHEYRFMPGRELWPHRMAWKHGELDHRLVLTMDAPFPELLERGFYPAMPWSLCAISSLPFWTRTSRRKAQPQIDPAGLTRRILTFELFRRLPFSELRDVLEKQLERGFSMLSEVTREDILQKGEEPQGKQGPHRIYPW